MEFELILIFWTMIENVINISFLEKPENHSCYGFLHYFASPKNCTSATSQPIHNSGSLSDWRFYKTTNNKGYFFFSSAISELIFASSCSFCLITSHKTWMIFIFIFFAYVPLDCGAATADITNANKSVQSYFWKTIFVPRHPSFV